MIENIGNKRRDILSDLSEMTNPLPNGIPKLQKLETEENDIQSQKTSEASKRTFKSTIARVQENVNSLQSSETSQASIHDSGSDDSPPLKKCRVDDRLGNRRYSKYFLKAFVMSLEKRHSEEYDLWRNVLWALNKYGFECEYDTLEIADCFSKRSLLKYKSFEDVKKTFESSDGSLSLQYLIDMSKIFVEDLEDMTNYVTTLVDRKYLPLTVTQVDFLDHRKITITVQLSNETVVWSIIPAQCMLVNQRGHILNFLTKKIVSDSSALASLCAELKDGFTVHLSKHDFIFSAKNGSPILSLIKPLNVFDNHAAVLKNNKWEIMFEHDDIRKVLLAETYKLLSTKFRKDIYDDIHLTDREFLSLYKSRYCREGNTIYHCDATTKLWHELEIRQFNWHLSIFYNELLKRKPISHIQEHAVKETALINIRNIILDEGEYVHWAGSLNSNLQLFFTDNRTIDTSSISPITRQIKKLDLAQTTCGWSYDSELSAAYHDSVELYFNKLFPLKCERDWFLSFIARMLNGKRNEELFVLLTDEGIGQCGITTLLSLLNVVFGKYYVSNTRIVVDKESQDNHLVVEGMYDLEKKRLLVADALTKKDTLNCDFIKAMTAECNHKIEWYKDNSYNEFALQAGLIMVVTDNNIPKFDKTDKHFRERMVVCPMRSRFVKQNFGTMSMMNKNMTNTRIADNIFRHDFSVWSSAVLDLLIKYYNTSVPTIPDSMVDYKKRVYEYFNRVDSHSYESHILNRRFIPSGTKNWESILAKTKFENGFIRRRNHVYINEEGKRVEAGNVIISKDLDNIEIIS